MEFFLQFWKRKQRDEHENTTDDELTQHLMARVRCSGPLSLSAGVVDNWNKNISSLVSDAMSTEKEGQRLIGRWTGKQQRENETNRRD